MTDETTGRLSPPHLQMLWNSSEFVGPGDVRDLIAEVRRLRVERDDLSAQLQATRQVVEAARAVRNGRYSIDFRLTRDERIVFDEFNAAYDEMVFKGCALATNPTAGEGGT
jgi:hypothetical protein